MSGSQPSRRFWQRSRRSSFVFRTLGEEFIYGMRDGCDRSGAAGSSRIPFGKNHENIWLSLGEIDHPSVVGDGRDLAGLVCYASAFGQTRGNTLIEFLSMQDVHHPSGQGGRESLALRQQHEDPQKSVRGDHVVDALLERELVFDSTMQLDTAVDAQLL